MSLIPRKITYVTLQQFDLKADGSMGLTSLGSISQESATGSGTVDLLALLAQTLTKWRDVF
jgi:hypothetical protein